MKVVRAHITGVRLFQALKNNIKEQQQLWQGNMWIVSLKGIA